MSNVNGRVDEVYSYNTKFGEMYGMVVNGNKYGAGKIKPRASAGDSVAFRYTENGQYKNIDMKTLEVSAGSAQESPSTAPNQSYSRGGESAGDRQNSIVRQNSVASAVAFLGVLQAADAIPGITKTMKSEERYGLINALLAETADEFFAANIKGVSLSAAAEEGDSRAEQAAGKAAADTDWK